jgi:hypothetical protein
MYVVYPKLSLEVTSRARLKNLDSPKRTLRGASGARLQCDLFLMDVDIRSDPEGTSKARSIAVFSPSSLMGPPGHVLTMWLLFKQHESEAYPVGYSAAHCERLETNHICF